MSAPNMTSVNVKVETYQTDGKGHGVRICFLYTDRSPEIFQKDGFPSEGAAHQWGKNLVHTAVQEIPGATAQEAPCQ